MKTMRVYLDNAATTPIAPEVVEAMIPVLRNDFGNPSSTHYFGRQTKMLLETSRRTIAKRLNCAPSELIFTSGGTEADNVALNTSVHQLNVKRIISTEIEHHAVGHTLEHLAECEGIEVVLLALDSKGNIDLNELESLLKDNKPTLVSLMHANNEIGTLTPIREVSQLVKKYNAYFHSDTVQTMGHYAFDLADLNIDFITCSAHKFHGPKGVGFLYVNKRIKPDVLIFGGAQERGYRGGTENLYGIVGLAKAIELAYDDLDEHAQHVQHVKSHMIQKLQEAIPGVSFIGETDPNKSLYTVLNVSLPPSEKSSMLLFTLDLKGVACSGGSACSSGATSASHVLTGIQADTMRPNVRFSFSRYTTIEEVEFAVTQLEESLVKTLA